MAVRDAAGESVHVGLAALTLACLTGPTSLGEIGMVPLAVCWLVRARFIAGLWAPLWLGPLGGACLLFTAWLGLGLLWTGDRGLGWEEFSQTRWLLLVPMLFPVMHRRGVLIGALLVGFAAGQGTQALHGLGRLAGWEWLTWNRMSGRNSGWWDPAVGGTLLMAALGLHLPAAVGRGVGGRARALGVAGSVAAGLGILATGTRGAWLAAPVLVLAAAALGHAGGAGRARAGRGGRGRTALVMVLVGLGVVGVATPLAWGPVSRRATEGWREVSAALRDGAYDSSTGARLAMKVWAWRAFVEQPLMGVGTGGYRAWARGRAEAAGMDPARLPVHAHAHDTALHLAASHGVVGLALGGLLAGAGLANGHRLGRRAERRVGRGAQGGGTGGGGAMDAWAMGPHTAMLGLLLMLPFDTLHVSTQPAAMFAALLALCPEQVVHRPGRGDACAC